MADLTTIADLEAELRQRRAEATVVPIVDGTIRWWKPEPRNCHANVETWVVNNPDDSIVRGFLVVDYPDSPYIIFNPHSLLRKASGELFDITPRLRPGDFPFLPFQGPEALFEQAVMSGSIIIAR